MHQPRCRACQHNSNRNVFREGLVEMGFVLEQYGAHSLGDTGDGLVRI